MVGHEAVAESLASLRECLTFETTTLASHKVIAVGGCDEAPAVEEVGRFLVGAIAQAIRTDLVLQPVLLSPGLDGQDELRRDIAKICGEEGAEITPYFRTHTRDPWIGEALGMLVLVLSGEVPHPCVPAPVVASHLPHVEAREHGLDLFAFAHPEFAVVIGEAKTSKSGIGSLLSDAEETLADIDGGNRDHDVRRAVNALLLSLDEGVRGEVVGAVWNKSRCYLPVACFQTGLSLENERPRLKALTDAAADCRLIAIRHADHDSFFEQVANAMWAAVPDISPA